MYKLIYCNLETDTMIREYCFASYEEKRRLYLECNGYEIICCRRLTDTFFSRSWWRNCWKCITHETFNIT